MMEILLENIGWMSFNIFLAVLGVAFGHLFLRYKGFLRALFFVLWFLFVPNTIYLVTDLIHFPDQFLESGFFIQTLLIAQYAAVFLLGIFTFLIGFYPLDQALSRRIPGQARLQIGLLMMMNFLIAFGVSLGRAERINSWDLASNPGQVLQSTVNLLTSPDAMFEILLFGILLNLLYFFSRRLFFRRPAGFFDPV